MEWPLCCLACFAVFLVLWFLLSPKQKSHYTYIGPKQTLGQANTYSNDLEKNEECLMLYGDRHCMMTDGRLGKCVLSGFCAPSMENFSEEIDTPYCTKPYFKEGCDRYCKCLEMSGEKNVNCQRDCKSWFHPYPML
jgi:hypothetical protein